MIASKWKKRLKILCAIAAIYFTLCPFAGANDLKTVVNKGNVHPKLSSRLDTLQKEHQERSMAARAYDQSRSFREESPNQITVYLISEPGTIIDDAALKAYDAAIIKSADNTWKARVPADRLENIADSVKGISFIKLPDRAIPLAIESEGVDLTGASSYHSAGHTGSGTRIAIIDLGFAGLSSAISDGELPHTVVMIDCTGSSCTPTDFSSETIYHGTAVAEIVYDMAPEAQLYLIKADDTLDLKDAKDYSIANGIKIINHSAGYTNTNFYDGGCYYSNSVCTADDAYSSGILWINSMGNFGYRHYGATFTDSDGDGFHNVSGDDETIDIDAFAGDIIKVALTWDAWPTTDQDYDLHLYDSNYNWVASSAASQTGTQPPTEFIYYSVPATATYHLAINKYQATSNHRFAVFSIEHGTVPVVASSSLASPADASGVLAVGAISQLNWTTGPLEYFSSRGPTNDGRTKPEISGPDYVTSYTYGGRFSGTSAASPYVAGAAAILLSANPTYSVSQLWNALTSSAVDMGLSGQDNSYGFGRLNLPPIPLKATTGSATAVTTNSAALNGTVHINGISTIYYFEYGTTASYGSKTAETVAGSGYGEVSVSAELTGLRAGKTYHFRLAATNSGGTSYGGDAAFTTQIVDSDGDGIEDGWEVQNFGNLTTADNTTDSDGDGLLDKDEYANETDPLLADTDGDGDSDGEEVIYGTDPLLITDSLDSHRPYKPVVSDSAGDVPLRDHVFDADGFSDPDQPLGDYLSASEWQISTDQNFGRDDIIYQRIFEKPADEAASIAESKLRQLLIQHGILSKASSYWIRTRYRDSVGLWSAWSDAVAFNSETIDLNDTDENGIDDQSQVQGYADTNNNGINDASEDILAFFGEKGDLIGMGTSNGTVGSFDAIPNSEIPVELIPDDPMPYGFFSFRIEGLPVDTADPARVDITFFFPTPLRADIKWYKFDPAAGTMTDFTANASITGSTAVISLTDGSSGDADGVVNGVIIDPGGPAVILAPGAGGGDSGIEASDSGGGGSGGGGCFITNATSEFRPAETYSAITLLLVFFVICIVKITTKQPGRI